jgi:type II secretory pathway pseudopilin PulG
MYKKSAFTLVEVIVAITLLMIIMIAVFVSYAYIININRRLELTRILQENTRIVTETIAQDVRDHGINFDYYYIPTNEALDYA